MYVSLSHLRVPEERAAELVSAFRSRAASWRRQTGSSIFRSGGRTGTPASS